MSRRKGFRIPSVSFSAKRALGITSAKRKFAKATGIPTTKSGRQRKLGSMGCGCLVTVLSAALLTVVLLMFLI